MVGRSNPVRAAGDGVEVEVWVVPGSSRPGIDGMHAGAIRVRVAAPPEGGRANAETVATVAVAVGARRGRVVRGTRSRRKVVVIPGVRRDAALDAFRRAGLPV